MARITVEDCLENIDNRFELVLVAAKRARQLADGKAPMVPVENDKYTVLALREIADGLVTRDILDEEPEVEEENLLEELFETELEAMQADADSGAAGTTDTAGATAEDADTVAEEDTAS